MVLINVCAKQDIMKLLHLIKFVQSAILAAKLVMVLPKMIVFYATKINLGFLKRAVQKTLAFVNQNIGMMEALYANSVI
jgi:hypothetical protein